MEKRDTETTKGCFAKGSEPSVRLRSEIRRRFPEGGSLVWLIRPGCRPAVTDDRQQLRLHPPDNLGMPVDEVCRLPDVLIKVVGCIAGRSFSSALPGTGGDHPPDRDTLELPRTFADRKRSVDRLMDESSLRFAVGVFSRFSMLTESSASSEARDSQVFGEGRIEVDEAHRPVADGIAPVTPGHTMM